MVAGDFDGDGTDEIALLFKISNRSDAADIKKVVFSRAVQKKNSHRFMALAVIVVVFLAVQYLAMEFMKMDLSEHVAVEIIYVIIPPVIVLACRMVLRWYRSKKFMNVTETAAEALCLMTC